MTFNEKERKVKGLQSDAEVYIEKGVRNKDVNNQVGGLDETETLLRVVRGKRTTRDVWESGGNCPVTEFGTS